MKSENKFVGNTADVEHIRTFTIRYRYKTELNGWQNGKPIHTAYPNMALVSAAFAAPAAVAVEVTSLKPTKGK